MNPFAAISRLLSALSRLAGLLVPFMWGRDRERRKAAEDTVEALKERNDIEKEVRIDSDDALIDRLSPPK